MKQFPLEKLVRFFNAVLTSVLRARLFSLAAAVAFYAVLAIFPGIAAIISLYAFFADSSHIASHIAFLSDVLPPGADGLIEDQMTRVIQAPHALNMTLAFSLALSVWSANAGVVALFDALNQAFRETETRSALRLYGTSLLFTAFTISFLALALGVIVAIPLTLNYFEFGYFGETLVRSLRWPLLYAGMACTLAIFYRYGASSRQTARPWMTPGAAIAAFAWLGGSVGFSWYVAIFDSFGRMYGPLGAVIAFMTWLWLSSAAALFGAIIDSQLRSPDV